LHHRAWEILTQPSTAMRTPRKAITSLILAVFNDVNSNDNNIAVIGRPAFGDQGWVDNAGVHGRWPGMG
jgi:hypothetical protein